MNQFAFTSLVSFEGIGLLAPLPAGGASVATLFTNYDLEECAGGWPEG